MDIHSQKFDVSLSFAGEDRKYVNEVAQQLVDLGFSVFYDKYFEIELIGLELVSTLRDIYGQRSRYSAVFISDHYLHKRWTERVEWEAILDKSTLTSRSFIIPIKLDESWLPGLPSSYGYIDACQLPPESVARKISQKLGTPTINVESDAELFTLLASDFHLVWQFMQEFRDAPNRWMATFRKDPIDIEVLEKFGQELVQYDLATVDSSLNGDGDYWVDINLTDRGIRFMSHLRQNLVPNW
ncbi:TIR domain-containing protein [Magnetovibrio sp.]|uniref:TIR domain-containing protein n=1 Tax=Magnetovibrio sp. TaxID=2024836 RepID=UPI002F94B45C